MSAKNDPWISVVIPLYNMASELPRCLESVLRQTFNDFEIIVVDDGSTDEGVRITRSMIRHQDRIISQRNTGVASARNTGIAECRGTIVSFLDADDEWDPIYLDVVYELSQRFPMAGILATGFRRCFRAGPDMEVTLPLRNGEPQQLVTDYFRRSAIQQFVWTGCVSVPKHVLECFGGFAEGVAHGEDLDLWARIAAWYPVAHDSRVLSSYYISPGFSAPRFRSSPRRLEVLRSLALTRDRGDSSYGTQRDITDYMRSITRDAALMVLRSGTRHDLAQLIAANNGSTFCPVLSMLSRMPIAEGALRITLAMRAMMNSRRMIRLIGGKHERGGVLVRLSGISREFETK